MPRGHSDGGREAFAKELLVLSHVHSIHRVNEPLLKQLRSDLETDCDDIRTTLGALGPQQSEPLAQMLAAGLVELEQALKRMDTGRYGSCERCRKPIGDARLQSLPAARLCLTCDADSIHAGIN